MFVTVLLLQIVFCSFTDISASDHSYTLRVLTQAIGMTTTMLRMRLVHKIHW